MNKIYVVAGPTGVGKTALSIKLAKLLDGEIINGDAFQVYKELNIGTAKITKEEQGNIPHHLFDIKSFNECFSVAEHQKLAREKISEIFSRNKTPIIVGGSGYYLKAILYNYDFSEEDTQHDFSKYTNEELYEKLKILDSNRAKTVHPNNRIRVERAIARHGKERPVNKALYNYEIIGITMDRQKLYERINKRVDQMIASGLINEINELRKLGATFDMQAMSAIGYKEFKDYFDGICSLELTIELIKRNTRRYAKKQYTWFNNQMNVTWICKDKLNSYIENRFDNQVEI